MRTIAALALGLIACGADPSETPAQAGSGAGGNTTTSSGGTGGAAPIGGSGAGASSAAGAATGAGCRRWDGALPAGKTMLVTGQDTGEIEAYGAAFGFPAGAMVYSNVADLAGFDEEVDFGAGRQSVPHWADHPQPLALQLGVSLMKADGSNYCASDHVQAIVSHSLDGAISSMAVELAASERPVLLRFGYEFDNGSCHSYEPSGYQQAFRQFVSLFRTLGAFNVKFVWNAWGGAPDDVSAWYPGDDYVDFVAVSVFPVGLQQSKLDAVASFAKARQKPLMIAESAPQAVHPLSDPNSWSGWFSGIFAYIEQNDVRVFSYINQDWNAQSVWAAQGIWGDSRVQGSAVESQWRSAVGAARFIQSSDSLYGEIGCSN